MALLSHLQNLPIFGCGEDVLGCDLQSQGANSFINRNGITKSDNDGKTSSSSSFKEYMPLHNSAEDCTNDNDNLKQSQTCDYYALLQEERYLLCPDTHKISLTNSSDIIDASSLHLALHFTQLKQHERMHHEYHAKEVAALHHNHNDETARLVKGIQKENDSKETPHVESIRNNLSLSSARPLPQGIHETKAGFRTSNIPTISYIYSFHCSFSIFCLQPRSFLDLFVFVLVLFCRR